ncbi:MAG TPA: murein L,D-transpeptidase catalytic domain family protein [Gemmatimonadaceae bacterium]|nr:murein L,D-transpeptidase catalytic domain family protein [Gemmatimonadaceae bacterium]
MRPPKYLQNVLVGASALLFAGAHFAPNREQNGPVLTAAVTFVSPKPAESAMSTKGTGTVATVTKAALDAFAGAVRPLSRPQALETAFRSYFAYKTAHPDEVRKPYLYFVDYGLPSTTPRGYVFDMQSLQIVDGPFTVAHGRGSSTSQFGVPTRFSNASGSAATSLGLYVAKSLYDFHGHASGQAYTAVGMRLMGVSDGFNDNAFARRVVAHGAPYVTPNKAGRSEGCPAMEPARAQQLLPKLADGGMVFLFAPDQNWMSRDPWIASGTTTETQGG